MPRYSFNCSECDLTFDKFIDYKDVNKVTCSSCGGMPSRSFSFSGSEVERTRTEIAEKAKAEAKEIVKKIKSGDQNAISEIYGEE